MTISPRRIAVVLALGFATLVATLALSAGSARADVPITHFATVPSTTQAGGHPDLMVAFWTTSRFQQQPFKECHCQDPRDISISLPPGLIGNPHSTPQCTHAEFALEICPSDSQIGINELWIFLPWVLPMYNMVPRPGEPGLVAFQAPIFRTPQYIEISPRTDSDYGLDAISPAINHLAPLTRSRFLFWGVPADPKHDMLRIPAKEQNTSGLDQAGLFCQADGVTQSTDDPNTVAMRCADTRKPLPSNSPMTPFLQNPTTCGGLLDAHIEVLAYDNGITNADTTYPAPTGCDQLSFNPSLAASPTTTEADTSSGLDVNLSVPQFQSPTVPSPSAIKATTVRLPAGFSINANAADGKSSCTDFEARFGTKNAAECPEFAKIGTLEIHSAVLPGPLPGFIYLGEPLPGNRYRLFLVADGFGVHVKLPGTASLDPQTGQIVVTFENLPQTPFEDFNLHLFGSERGVLATPERCGTYEVNSTFTPWNSALSEQTSKQFFEITAGPGGTPCPGGTRPFSPRLRTGMADNTAGQHSTFTLDLTRSDGEQNLSAINVATPPGFSGKLAGIPYCPEAALQSLATEFVSGVGEIAAPSCSQASQVGSAVTGAGAGTRPLHVDGKVYLAGPYRGAPLSLAVVVPAVSGPFDLGTVAVRVAIHVDPATARISAYSDPLPAIVEGIPLRVRTVRVSLDRPGFTINPTNCDRATTDARIFGDEGALFDVNNHFQVGNCASLAFEPKLALRVSRAKRRSHPALSATLTPRAGDANLQRVVVTLPDSLQLDQSHIGDVCTRVQFASKSCPASSVYGTATAASPLLDAPLRGNVYLRSSDNELPDLAVDLRGQVDFALTGVIDSKAGGLRTNFAAPDVPVSNFVLRMEGGRSGLVVVSSKLCGKNARADIRIKGQNGRNANSRPRITAPCGKRARKARGR